MMGCSIPPPPPRKLTPEEAEELKYKWEQRYKGPGKMTGNDRRWVLILILAVVGYLIYGIIGHLGG